MGLPMAGPLSFVLSQPEMRSASPWRLVLSQGVPGSYSASWARSLGAWPELREVVRLQDVGKRSAGSTSRQRLPRNPTSTQVATD